MISLFDKNIDSISSLEECEESFQKEKILKKDLEYEVYENPVSKILLYKENNEVLGYLDFWITFDSSTIFKIIVKDEYRNKGIAKKLLEESFKILKKEKVLYMTLEVRKSNIYAIKLYESCEFKKVTVKEKYYKDGEDAIYMVKGIY